MDVNEILRDFAHDAKVALVELVYSPLLATQYFHQAHWILSGVAKWDPELAELIRDVRQRRGGEDR